MTPYSGGETGKTAAFLGVAVVLIAIAWSAAPRRATPAGFSDRGSSFFPAFTDPNGAASLEVVEFDETTSTPRPFKVMNRAGRWTIPSHDNYPADATNRLSQIAASVIALKKDDVASDNAGDQERCGVLDPLDDTLATPTGRGTRITVRGANDKLLADIIVGKPVEGRANLRYVRLPAQQRTYIADVGSLAISTRFDDWIERNLLLIDRADIDRVIIRNYSTDAKTGKVDLHEMLVLSRPARDVWKLDGADAGVSIDTFRMNLLITKLVELSILDVRPKPAGVAAALSDSAPRERIPQSDVTDLASKGFYFTSDGGVLANQGEVVVHASSGIFYILRFGEVAYGTADGRYLFISVGFDPQASGAGDAAKKRLEILRARFAPWYYLVSNDSFQKIRLSRSALIKAKTATPTK